MNHPQVTPQGAIRCFFCPLGKKKSPKATWGEITLQSPPNPNKPPNSPKSPQWLFGFYCNFPQNPKFPPERIPPRKTPQGKLGDLFYPLGQKNSPNSPWGTKTTQLPPNIGGWTASGGRGLASPRTKATTNEKGGTCMHGHGSSEQVKARRTITAHCSR